MIYHSPSHLRHPSTSSPSLVRSNFNLYLCRRWRHVPIPVDINPSITCSMKLNWRKLLVELARLVIAALAGAGGAAGSTLI